MAGKQDSTAKAIETNKWNPHSLCPEKHHSLSFHTYSVCVYGCVSDCTFLTLRYLAFPQHILVLTFYYGHCMYKADILVEWYTMYPSPNHCHQVVILPSCLMPPTSRHPCYFQIPGIILPHSTCILHVSLKDMYKVCLTCLVLILFTVVYVFIRHIVFHYTTYFISATCLSLSLSLIICCAFRKLYGSSSNRYLISRL